jgi:hypothetical protein
MNPDDHPFINTITDRHGNVTHVHRILRDTYEDDSGELCGVRTGDYAYWRIPEGAQLALVDVGGMLGFPCVADDLDRVDSPAPAWADRDEPRHVQDIVDLLADRGVAVRLDGPHSAPPFLLSPGETGAEHWRVMLVRDRVNHIIAEIGADLILPDTGGEGCTVHAWARELDDTGERTQRYAEIPQPKQVQCLADGIAEMMLTTPITYE